MKPGDIELKKGFFYNNWIVYVGIDENNVDRRVAFRDFENAQIFSAITKLNDAFRDK